MICLPNVDGVPALTVQNPWGHLIAWHSKGIENRTWRPPAGATRILVHAGKGWDPSGLAAAREVGANWSRAVPSAIVALVEITGVCGESRYSDRVVCGCGRWARPGQYHWGINTVWALAQPVPCSGGQRLWKPPGPVCAALAGVPVARVRQPLLVEQDRTLLDGHGASAVFSPCRSYRYALTRRWGTGAMSAAFVMLNPSTADAFTTDPTVRRCLGFARGWGASGLVVVNAFGLRATDPGDLYRHPDPVGPDNDMSIAEHLADVAGPVVCAWGTHGALHGRGAEVAALLREIGVQPLCLGTTKDGHPRHPLYLPQTAQLSEYDTPTGG